MYRKYFYVYSSALEQTKNGGFAMMKFSIGWYSTDGWWVILRLLVSMHHMLETSKKDEY